MWGGGGEIISNPYFTKLGKTIIVEHFFKVNSGKFSSLFIAFSQELWSLKVGMITLVFGADGEWSGQMPSCWSRGVFIPQLKMATMGI